MKKLFSIILVLLLIGGCTNNQTSAANNNLFGNQNETADAYKPFENDYSEDFEYTFTTIYSPRIAVANDGKMAVSSQKSKDTAGVQFVEYGMDGSSRAIGEYDGYIDSLAYMGDDLLFAIVKWNTELKSEGVLIYKVNTGTGNNELFAEIDGIPITYVFSANGNSEELYLLGEDSSKSNNDDPLPGISSANSIIRYHDGSYEKLSVEFPTAVCAKKTGGAIIAAYDADGYYITAYENGQLSDKKYINSNGAIRSIADVDGRHIVYTVPTKSDKIMLCAANTDNMYNAELIPDSTAGEELFSTGGLCFFNAGKYNTNEAEQTITIKRIDFSGYYKERPPMNLMITGYSDSTPFGCGYTINVNELSSEEAALKILSLDKDYDMCYISTRDRIAYSLKSQGSFYPLNDVTGVSEYLDKCFPAIKEAFTDENGNIWALPIWSNSYFIAKNTGETDFSEMTTDSFIDYVDGLSESDTSESLFNAYIYTDEILKEYVMSHDSFDTPEFRNTAEKLKKSGRVNFAAPEYKMMVSGDYDNPLFLESTLMILGVENSYSFKESGAQNYSVTGIPCVSGKNVLLPNVIFLCANPDSEHLSDALDYISKIADYQMKNPDQFVLTQENGVYSDNDTVRQMAELHNSAEVYFTYPAEIYWEDFYNYLSDRISLEQFITEADRKLKVYLNE